MHGAGLKNRFMLKCTPVLRDMMKLKNHLFQGPISNKSWLISCVILRCRCIPDGIWRVRPCKANISGNGMIKPPLVIVFMVVLKVKGILKNDISLKWKQ